VRRTPAFTLMETIVAIVVLGVALPPMLLALREAQRRSTGPIQPTAPGGSPPNASKRSSPIGTARDGAGRT
jgi:prepilin-type N-terminal cleavage/methylation domain-containing protein